MALTQLYILKEDDSEIKMIYAMLSYVIYTPRYLKISTLTGVSNTNFVMLMTSSTIVIKGESMPTVYFRHARMPKFQKWKYTVIELI
jgi:hypothetical protein